MATQEEAAGREVPESNRTQLGLYVWPDEAYEKWKADPDNVRIIDIRTFEEYVFGGHPEMAQNVPLVFRRYNPDGPSMPGRPAGCSGELNPDFVSSIKDEFESDAVLIMMCATGGRGAMAANLLAQAGFDNVYNMVNGLEGDRVDDPGSVYHGKHMRNGWKNLGLPWGYDFHPDLMWVDPTP